MLRAIAVLSILLSGCGTRDASVVPTREMPQISQPSQRLGKTSIHIIEIAEKQIIGCPGLYLSVTYVTESHDVVPIQTSNSGTLKYIDSNGQPQLFMGQAKSHYHTNIDIDKWQRPDYLATDVTFGLTALVSTQLEPGHLPAGATALIIPCGFNGELEEFVFPLSWQKEPHNKDRDRGRL